MGYLRLQPGDDIWDVVFVSVDTTDGFVAEDFFG